MQISLLYSGIAICLFILAVLFNRRFGLLGLGLAVGLVLSDIWTDWLLDLAKQSNIIIEPYAPTLLKVMIILTPVLIFLFKGFSYKGLIGRFIGAGMFVVLAIAFLIKPLSYFWAIQGVGDVIFNFILEKRTIIMGIGLLFAVADFFIAKPSYKPRRERTH